MERFVDLLAAPLPQGGRPSRATGGDFKRGGQGTYNCTLDATNDLSSKKFATDVFIVHAPFTML